MVDQLSAKWLEAAHAGIVDLPNVRALARRGARFNRAYSANPVCAPARATVATGLTSMGHGVPQCGYVLDPSIPTFMRMLQKTGWRTGAFGKVHFEPQVAGSYPDYSAYGYDVTAITEDQRTGPWLDWVKAEYPEHYTAALSTIWMTMVKDLGEYGPDRTNLRPAIEEAKRAYPQSTQRAYTLPFPEHVSQSAWITDKACDFIRGTDRQKPVMAHVSYVQPHNPFSPPANYVDRVRVDAIPEPIPGEWGQEAQDSYIARNIQEGPTYDTSDWLHERTLYFADLAHLDDQIGRLTATLQAEGRLDNSFIIFTSDHGEMLHDHGFLGKWERHYDACIRIPLIVAGPVIVPGDYDGLTELMDIAPTIVEMAGLPAPYLEQPDLGMGLALERVPLFAGRSLMPALCRGATATRTSLLVQSNGNHWSSPPINWARTILTDRYRYTTYLQGGGEQMFDLIADPDERNDLTLSGDARELRQQLRDELFELVASEGYPNSPRMLYGLGTW